MNKNERHDRILHLAGERGMIYLDRAAQATGASLPTIRRDFAELADAGSVERIRGGIRVSRKDENMPFNLREVQRSNEKSAIARNAAKRLRGGRCAVYRRRHHDLPHVLPSTARATAHYYQLPATVRVSRRPSTPASRLGGVSDRRPHPARQ